MASRKPAATEKPATEEKPAKQKPAGVTIHDLAADLGTTNTKAVRAKIRRVMGGAQVGQGGRYGWDSKADPAYKELLGKLQSTEKAVKVES